MEEHLVEPRTLSEWGARILNTSDANKKVGEDIEAIICSWRFSSAI